MQGAAVPPGRSGPVTDRATRVVAVARAVGQLVRSSTSHSDAAGAFPEMMEAVATRSIPPFEAFYLDHRDEVIGVLRRMLGAERADDAFQETFLRALRAYDRLDHAEHLRAWVLTIARNVALDVHRRTRPMGELPELPHDDDLPPILELSELTDGLPATERAAVVLRYGYDLDYQRIADLLGSSPDAARQAASAGVRRLRRRTP